MPPKSPLKIAIVDSNALSCIGMTDLLEMVMPSASIRPFLDMTELQQDADLASFGYFFVSAPMYLSHVAFFKQQKRRIVVWVPGENTQQLTGVTVLHVNQPIPALMKDLQRLKDRMRRSKAEVKENPVQLSTRELEVLSLIARGMMNKEIAQQLHIELTTVITHRKKIMHKLDIHTVSGLTLYALMNGIIHVGDI